MNWENQLIKEKITTLTIPLVYDTDNKNWGETSLKTQLGQIKSLNDILEEFNRTGNLEMLGAGGSKKFIEYLINSGGSPGIREGAKQVLSYIENKEGELQ